MPASADVQVVSQDGVRDVLGEGLFWSVRENALYWTDILSPALNRLSLIDNVVTRWAMPEMIGWVIERRDAPGFIAGFKSGFAELRLGPLTITPIVDPEPDLPHNRLNDAKADAQGRIWAGSMAVAIDGLSGALHRFDPDRSVTRIDDGYVVANGPAFSPDGRWLYHNDTARRVVYRFRLEDGAAIDRQPFITFDRDMGYPDGMTTDADGHLWIAQWGVGSVSRFDPDGVFERSVRLPASQISNVAFAGAELDRMFVTSASDGVDEPLGGALFEIDPGVRGLPPGLFAG